MQSNYTHISVLIDKSGSMQSCLEPTVAGFNKFLEEQKAQPGKATMTMVQFDDRYELNSWFIDLKYIAPLNTQNYVPRGATALLDAMKRLIDDTGRHLSSLSEAARPANVLFVVITDGEENASKDTTRDQVFKLVKHQTDTYNWNFIYLGANQDAISVGMGMGIQPGFSISYATSKAGINNVYHAVSTTTSALRGTNTLSMFEASARAGAMEQDEDAPKTNTSA